MPYYQWKAVDLQGRYKRGKIFASSTEALDLILFNRDMAHIASNAISTHFLARITQETIKQFFEQLATLLRAGVLLPEALAILRDSMGHVRMQILIDEIAQEIDKGVPLHAALAARPHIFDEQMVQMVYIGQETGSLPITVQAIATHIDTVLAFKAKIKSAAMVPLISFLFFLAIIAVIIVGIIPTFASVFASINQPLPTVTRALIAISNFVRSGTGLVSLGLGTMLIMLAIQWVRKKAQVKQVYDAIIIRIPFFSDILYNSQRAWFLDSLVLLVRGGMPLVPALSIAQRSCSHSVIYEYVSTVGQRVALGSPLSGALERCPGNFFSAQDFAIIAVGENIGQLVPALSQTADISRNRATRSLALLTTVIQPLLLIVLGLLITLLILAIYAPLFTLSWAIA